MSRHRGALSSGVVGGKVYAVGGYWDGKRPRPDPHPTNGGALTLVEVFDPSTNTWSVGTPLSDPRTKAVAAVLNDTLWVVGGEDNDGYTLRTMEAVKQG